MGQIIHATFQNGAFVPDEPVSVAAGTRVTVTVDEAATQGATAENQADVATSSEAAFSSFVELSRKVQLKSGIRMTRDELHDRD